MPDYEYEDDEENYGCPYCDGPAMVLGTLGNLLWMRCRDCGLEYNTDKLEEDQHE